MLAPLNFDQKMSVARAGTTLMHSCKLVQTNWGPNSHLRVPAGPRLQSPSKYLFINGRPNQESTIITLATCIIANLFLSSGKNSRIHSMTNCFTTSHTISFGSPGDPQPRSTFMGSSIRLRCSYKPTRTSSSLHQNQDVIASGSLSH